VSSASWRGKVNRRGWTGVGLGEPTDGPQGAAVEGGAQGVVAGAQLLQQELLAAAVGELEAEGLAAWFGVAEEVVEAGDAVDLRDVEVDGDADGELLLEVDELAREVVAELGGAGGSPVASSSARHDDDDAVERLAALLELLEDGEPGLAHRVGAREGVGDLEVDGAAGGREDARAVVGRGLGRGGADAVAVDLDEAGGAGRAEQGRLAVAGLADEREPRGLELGGQPRARDGGAALVAVGLGEDGAQLLEAGALGEDRGVDGGRVGGGGPALLDDPADEGDQQREDPHRGHQVDDEHRLLLRHAEARGHAHHHQRRGEHHCCADEQLHWIFPPSARRSARRWASSETSLR
jgi:hypothetical protein